MIVYLTLLVLVIAGGALAFAGRSRTRAERLALFIVMPLTFVTLLAMLQSVIELPISYASWSTSRMATAFAIADEEYSLYAPADEGTILNTIYAPLSAVSYLPATVASTPARALQIGLGLNAIYFFGPVLVLFLFGERRPSLLGFLYFLSFAWLVHLNVPMNNSAWHLHADPFAIGATAIGCMLIGRLDLEKPDRVRLGVIALMMVLAGWTKQTFAPVTIAFVVIVAMRHGKDAAMRLLVIFLVLFGVSFVIIAQAFGLENMLMNILVVPGNHPWIRDVANPASTMDEAGIADRLMSLETAFRMFYYTHGLLILVALGGLLVVRFMGGPSENRVREFWGHPAAVFVVTGMAVLPTGMLGMVKAGGAINSFGPATYFLTVGALLLLREQELKRSLPLGLGLVLMLAVPKTINVVQPAANSPVAEILNRPSTQFAYEFEIKHPGRAWFPLDTLGSYMAGRPLYHFMYGVYDRNLGGVEVTPAHFYSGIPEDPEFIALPQRYAGLNYVQIELGRYLPDYTEPVHHNDLPGFVLFRRPVGEVNSQ